MKLLNFKIPLSKWRRIYLAGYWTGYSARRGSEFRVLEKLSRTSVSDKHAKGGWVKLKDVNFYLEQEL
jgi:hypothetical protein